MAVHARYLLDKPFLRTVFRLVAWRQDPIWGHYVKSVLYAGYLHPPGYPPTLHSTPRKVMAREPAAAPRVSLSPAEREARETGWQLR